MSAHLLPSATIADLHGLVVVAIAVRVIVRRPARGVAPRRDAAIRLVSPLL